MPGGLKFDAGQSYYMISELFYRIVGSCAFLKLQQTVECVFVGTVKHKLVVVLPEKLN